MKQLCLIAFLCFFRPSQASQIDKEDESQVNIISGEQPMPFRLGIELQEIHHLCKDAKLRQDIQKKPLFFVKDNNSILWELVIDGEDIEFVLKPFSHTKYNLLEKAISSANSAAALLSQPFSNSDLEKALDKSSKFIGKNSFELKVAKGLCESNLFPNENSFHIWKVWLQTSGHGDYASLADESFEGLWTQGAQDLKVAVPPEQLFRMAQIPQYAVITIEEWFREIEAAVFKQDLTIEKQIDYFPKAQGFLVSKNPEIKFMPQATIQYPIEYSIPLFFSLFDFRDGSLILTKLLSSLPFLDEFDKYLMGEYCSKKCGLVFLHGLTLYEVLTQEDDLNSLYVIQARHTNTEQVDAKGLLNFMSRRPFSDMWKDIQQEGEDFSKIYLETLGKNRIFSQKFFNYSDEPDCEEKGTTLGWKDTLYPRYAEEFFEENKRRDLSGLSHLLTGDLSLSSANSINDPLAYLLKNGIVPTTIIRRFSPEGVSVITLDSSNKTPQGIFENYCERAVESVQVPSVTYEFDAEAETIKEKDSNFDFLSPPWFLHEDDSMGFLKDYNPRSVKKYGEAIVEIRCIKNAFSHVGDFLTQANSLTADSRILFDFLKSMHETILFSKEHKKRILNFISRLEGELK